MPLGLSDSAYSVPSVIYVMKGCDVLTSCVASSGASELWHHNLLILSYSTTSIPSLNSLFFASHSSFFLALSLVSAQLEQLFPVPQAKNFSAVLLVMPSTVLLPSKKVSSLSA